MKQEKKQKKSRAELLREIFNFKGIKFYNFILLTVAGIVNAVGVTMFLVPANLYDGGLSGTSFLLSNVTPLSLSLWLIILNVPFFLVALKKAGIKYIIYSLWAIGMYSLFSYLFQNVFGIDFSDGSPIAGQDVLLCCLFGGLISGIGSGLTIRAGGALDGVEVAATFCAKKLGLSVGTFVMIYNVIVYTVAGVVFKAFSVPLYSVIAYAVGLKAVDFIVDGFDKGKAVFVITDKSQTVASALSEEFGRGLTVINAKGFYSQTEKIVLYCVVNRFELSKLKSIVEQTDSQAFIAVSEVTDTLGSDLKFSLFKRKSNLEKIINQSELSDSPCEVLHQVPSDEQSEPSNNSSEGKTDNGGENNKV